MRKNLLLTVLFLLLVLPQVGVSAQETDSLVWKFDLSFYGDELTDYVIHGNLFHALMTYNSGVQSVTTVDLQNRQQVNKMVPHNGDSSFDEIFVDDNGCIILYSAGEHRVEVWCGNPLRGEPERISLDYI